MMEENMSGILRIVSAFSSLESGVVSCVMSEVWEEEAQSELPSEVVPEGNEIDCVGE